MEGSLWLWIYYSQEVAIAGWEEAYGCGSTTPKQLQPQHGREPLAVNYFAPVVATSAWKLIYVC